MKIPIETSNRHVHLSKKDIDTLFGKNYSLKISRKLSQPGEFAAEEKVTLSHDDKKIENVRVLGPLRNRTQIELLSKDASTLGISPKTKNSGDHEDTPGIEIIGPNGKIKKENGVIVANRHLHITEEEAELLKIKEKIISLKVKDKILDNVAVRINSNSKLAVHINKDDDFAKHIDLNTHGELV